MKTELTTEESAKLIELGIDPKLASKGTHGQSYEDYCLGNPVTPEDIKPIFTLTDILSILPKEIDNGYNLNIDITGKYYGAAYVCWDEDENWDAVIKDICFEAIAPELIDALNQLLIRVITSGHLKIEKK